MEAGLYYLLRAYGTFRTQFLSGVTVCSILACLKPYLKVLLLMQFYWRLLCLLCCSSGLQAQVYYEQASRHRFAQLTLGVELESGWGGQTNYLATDGRLLTQDLASTLRPRILIGGMHFWGHADFSIAFPLSYPEQRTSNLNLAALSGVETIFKYYPFAVRRGGIRPYLGFSLAPFTFFQDNSILAMGEGPSRTYVRLPLKTGLTFSLANHLFDLGLTYNYANTIDYPLSPELNTEITTPPLFAHLSYRYQLETTLSAERGWEDQPTSKKNAPSCQDIIPPSCPIFLWATICISPIYSWPLATAPILLRTKPLVSLTSLNASQ